MQQEKSLRAMRAKLHDQQNRVKHTLLNQRFEVCMMPYSCIMCKPDYVIALVMALHPRLGDQSPLAALLADLLQMIIQMTRPSRMLPGWMSCTWNLYLQQRRLARAVLECSRAAQRKRDVTNNLLG